ncbi:MAG TPA: hypothetical protein VFR51_19055 [Pyrinomonadaceae bacterium]|nr:hypothetical protein [Pyrinomonadaceae bacterium]
MNPCLKIVVPAMALASILMFPQSAGCQAKKPPGKTVQQTKKPPEDRTHWKFLLDSLIVETRLVDPEDERALVMADVADAYWLIDQQQAKKLFTEAFDAALAFPRNEPVAPVLSRIAKRDRALATELTKRLLAAKSDDTDSAARSFRAARELFETDPKFSIELAKLSASTRGPSLDGLSFVFKVAGSDPAAATEIYEAYINNIARTGNSDLGSILFLAGYPFGYGEAYGGSNDPGMLHGFWGMRVPGLKPQPELAARYLQIAFAAITNTLKKAAGAGDVDKEVLNALALYSTSYLFPEVQRYLPDAEPAWSGLYRQALAGTTAARQAEIEQRLRFMQESRGRTSQQSAEEYARADAKEKLAEIDKLPNTCSRDRAYAQVALSYSYAKEFTQARQIADRIDNLEQRDSVLQFTYYDEAAALLERGDLVRALDWVEKVAAKDQRAVLYVRIASAALKKSDKAMVLDALNRARSLVRDSDDAQLQAGVLLSVGAIFAQFDASEATYVTRESVKAINRMKEPVDETFSVLRRVNLGCAAGEISWHGSRERVDTFNFYETLGAIARSDAQAEGALALASEVQDKPTRIRAQLSIVKAVIK